MKSSHTILIAPWFSEKALIKTEQGIYTFEVPKAANKYEIAKAVTEIYKVTPMKVRIVNIPGKPVALRTRRGSTHRRDLRKAYVYLKKGDTIQFA